MVDNPEKLQAELKLKQICRFCLTQGEKLTNIYSREFRATASAPLPLQVMACVSIEVFSNDGMPSFVCSKCRLLFEHCYRFKQMCKKADNTLRQYPLTGKWPEPLDKPKIPGELLPKGVSQKLSPTANSYNDETIHVSINDNPDLSLVEETVAVTVTPFTQKPKLLNKQSIRILNKEASITFEPRLSAPQIKRDIDGNVAVVTEILDPSVPYEQEPDPVKTAEPIETNVFPCPHCERSFPLKQLRDIHMVNHNRQRGFQCPECNKRFFSKYDLQKHLVIHTGDKPYKCVICLKAFTRATLLHRHEKVHTDIPKFICVFCEKPFISKEEMERHTERHRKKRPFPCKICNKSFAFKQGLERHEVVHSRDQPFPCQYCEQSFSTPSKLARHLTAHAGKRPYPCKFCSKSYLLSHHLTRHLRSHKNGLGLFTCSDCKQTFTSRDDLFYHSAEHATHTLVCPLCKEAFKNIDAVTNHIKQHADGDSFACEFCDLIFMTSERLQEHTDAEHSDEMEAYHEDDQANAERLAAEAASQDEEDDEESYNHTQEIDQAIEEFLIDEFSDDIVVKEESNWSAEEQEETKAPEKKQQKQKILNKVAISQPNASDEENFLMMGNSTLASNESETFDEDMDQQQPPPKIRKISGAGAKIVGNISKTPVARKKPVQQIVKDEADESSSPGGSLKLKQPTINSVLQALPKSLSVKRSIPVKSPEIVSPPVKAGKEISPPNVKQKTVVKAKQPPAQALKTSPEKASSVQTSKVSPKKDTPSPANVVDTRIKRITRVKRTSDNMELPTVQPTQEEAIKKNPINTPTNVGLRKSTTKPTAAAVRKSTSATASPAVAAAAASTTTTKPIEGEKKIVEMMIGDRRVKVQKITMTKAQAAAMTKDGRIHMKDGAMILKQPSGARPAQRSVLKK